MNENLMQALYQKLFFFSSRRRNTRWNCDWSSDVCSSDLSFICRTVLPHNPRQPQTQPQTHAGRIPDLHKAYPPVRIDNKTCRYRMNTPCRRNPAIRVVYHSEAQSMFAKMFRHLVTAAALHRHGNDIRVIVCDGFNSALLRAANRTPGRPEMHQHRLRRPGSQDKWLSIKQRALQRWRCPADDVALLPGAYARDQRDDQQHLDGTPQPYLRPETFFSRHHPSFL